MNMITKAIVIKNDYGINETVVCYGKRTEGQANDSIFIAIKDRFQFMDAEAFQLFINQCQELLDEVKNEDRQ